MNYTYIMVGSGEDCRGGKSLPSTEWREFALARWEEPSEWRARELI